MRDAVRVSDSVASDDAYARRRATVERFLRESSSTLGALYGYASGLLDDRRPDGWQHLVAHVGRELMNRLADHLAEVPTPDPDAPARVTRLPEIADRLSEALAGGDAEVRAVAQELVDRIARGSDQAHRRAAALVAAAETGAEPDDAARQAWVRGWTQLQQRFAGWAHLRGRTVPEIAPKAIEAAWRELTDLLAMRVAQEPFFESLDELLELARRPQPDRVLAQAALARLRPGTKSRFYAELQDAAWVPLLAAAGMFSAPPPAIRDNDTIRFPDWPEGLVLIAFASRAPEEVVRAATAVPPSDNARVAQLLAHAAASLPATLVADRGLARRVVQDLSGPARLLDVAEPAGAMAANLARDGRVNKALDVLDALLQVEVDVTPSSVDWMPDHRHGRFRHDEYLADRSARAMLADLVAGGARATVRRLIDHMRRAQEHLAVQDSSRWRDAVAETRSPYGNDPRHLILELLRDAALALAARGDEDRAWVLEQLESKQSEVFERLRLHLLGRLPDEQPRRTRALADPDVLFSRERLGEVYPLLPVAFAAGDDAERRQLVTAILDGPDPSHFGLPASELETLGEEVAAWQDEWRQRLLTALEEQLQTVDRERLDALRQRRGVLEKPGYAGVRTTSWVGPTSPRGVAQLSSMDPDSLVAFLADFRAEGHFAVPTPEGLGRELTRAVEAAPSAWLWLSDRISEVPPLYVRSWLAGFQVALRAEAALDEPHRLLEAIDWVFEQPADPQAQGQPLEDDVDFYAAQLAAMGVLETLLVGNRLALWDRERVWGTVERTLYDPDPLPEREAASDAEALQLALSAVRPRGVTLLLRYLGWLDLRVPSDEGPGQRGFAAAPETREPLEHLIHEDPSRAVRAALAAELSVLAALDATWLGDRIASIADPEGDPLARIGWSTYLNYSGLSTSLATLLAEAYRRAVATIATQADEGERRELAEHVALLWRDVPQVGTELLGELAASGEDVDCARAVAILGRALHPRTPGDYEPSDADLDRHRALWDQRLAATPGADELREFGWWWSSGRFERADDIRRLTQSVTLATGRIGDLRDALEVARDKVAGDPTLREPVLALLEALVASKAARGQYVSIEVLSALLIAPLADTALRDRAVVVVHALGEQGYLPLRALLD